MILVIDVATFDCTSKLDKYTHKERKKTRGNSNLHLNKSLRQAIMKLKN